MPLERAIGRAILKGLAGENLPISQMISIARRADGGYRYQVMLEDARKFTGRVKYQTQVERLSYNAVVPRSYMIETSLNQDVRYRVLGKATFYDEESGQYFSKDVSFYTDDYAKVGDYGKSFSESFGEYYEDQDLPITEFKVIGIEHNAGYDY